MDRCEASCPYHLEQALNSYLSNDKSGTRVSQSSLCSESEWHVLLLSA